MILDIYPGLNSLNGTTDPTDVLLYAHQLSQGVLAPLILAGFFLIALLGSFFASIQLYGRGRIDASFAAAGFVTFGLAVIMSLKNGLLEPTYLWFSVGIAIIGVLWIIWPSEPQ